MLLVTRREAPNDAVTASHILMERTSMIRKLAAGVYNYYPFMLRAIRKVETIIRQELDRAGAQELLMPAVQPSWLWEKSGRWAKYGPELLRVRDRKGNEFCVGPTHEEVITNIVANEVKSYKQLPLNLYQIQTKFRDEIRPRFGVMRGREFIMKDAYTFDVDGEGAAKSYWNMHAAYHRLFERCGLKFRAVAADTGNIGGTLSHEFQVLADSGEDAIASCTHCDYAANIEKAETRTGAIAEADPAAFAPLEDVATPQQKSIEEVSTFLGVAPTQLVKTLIYFDDRENFYAVAIRGDLEVNELKLKNHLDVMEVYPAEEKDILTKTGAPVGFLGPRNLKVPVICDHSIKGILNGVTGANKTSTPPGISTPFTVGPTCGWSTRATAVPNAMQAPCASTGALKSDTFFIWAPSIPNPWKPPSWARTANPIPAKWAATASASPVPLLRPSSRTTTKTASAGPCPSRRIRY